MDQNQPNPISNQPPQDDQTGSTAIKVQPVVSGQNTPVAKKKRLIPFVIGFVLSLFLPAVIWEILLIFKDIFSNNFNVTLSMNLEIPLLVSLIFVSVFSHISKNNFYLIGFILAPIFVSLLYIIFISFFSIAVGWVDWEELWFRFLYPISFYISWLGCLINNNCGDFLQYHNFPST